LSPSDSRFTCVSVQDESIPTMQLNRKAALALCMGLSLCTIAAQAEDPLADMLGPAGPTAGGVDRGAGGGSGPSKEPVQKPQVKSVISEEQAKREKLILEAFRLNEPLSPKEILDTKQMQLEVDRARSKAAEVTPLNLSIPVSLKPGAGQKVITVASGFVSALSVLDATGQPWAIKQESHDASVFFAEISAIEPNNVILISPSTRFSKSNLVLMLEGAATPLVLNVEYSETKAVFSASLSVDQRGPNALRPSSVSSLKPVDSDLMRSILDGAGPVTDKVKQIEIDGGDAEAFYSEGRFFLRTELELLSPAWIATIKAGSMSVYELPVVPVIIASDRFGTVYEIKPTENVLVDGALSSKSGYDPLPKF